jgi:hypothetical protein
MARRTLFLAAALLVAALAPSASAEDPPAGAPAARPGGPPPAPGAAGPVFVSGPLTVPGPAGWVLEKGGGELPTWTRLAVLHDPVSRAVAIVSGRRAQAFTLPKLRQEVSDTYARDAAFKVLSIVDLPVGGARSLPGVLADATQTKPADPPPAGTPPPATPAPPTVLRSHDAYFLGGDTEYRVFVQARATLWSRLAPLVDRMLQGTVVKSATGARAPRGEGAFSHAVAGFHCKVPPEYAIRIPNREDHVVEFAPASEGPVVGVYRYPSDHDLDFEAKALVDYYQGSEVGGEATTGTGEVAGRAAAFVQAKGNVAGKDQVFHLAVVKRGGETFRLRVAAPADQVERAKQVFDAFVRSFVITSS